MKAIKILTTVSLSIICSITLLTQNSGATTKEKAPADHQTQNPPLKTEIFKVYGNCGMCKKRIEKAANSVNGIKSATWDVETKMLTVQYNEYEWAKDVKSMNNVIMKIAEAGHDTKNYKADTKAYTSLPQCCQYERHEKPEKHQHNKGHHHMRYNH